MESIDMLPWFIAAGILLLLNVAASVVILRHPGYTARQRGLQCVIAWGLPLVGALVCIVFGLSDRSPGSGRSGFDPLYHPGDGGGPDIISGRDFADSGDAGGGHGGDGD